MKLDINEIRNLSPEEIDGKALDLKKELFNLRIEAKNQKLEQVNRLKGVRRDIARLLTIKREKQLEETRK